MNSLIILISRLNHSEHIKRKERAFGKINQIELSLICEIASQLAFTSKLIFHVLLAIG